MLNADDELIVRSLVTTKRLHGESKALLEQFLLKFFFPASLTYNRQIKIVYIYIICI